MSVGHRCSLLHPQQARVRCPLQLHLDKLDIRVHTLHLMRDIWKMIYFMIERIWWARLQSQNQMRIFCVLVFSDWGASMRVSGLRFPPHLMFSVRLCILPPRPGPICPNMWEGHTVWDTLGHTHCVGHGTLGISTPLLSPLVTTLTLSPSTYGGGPPIW